MCFCIFKKGRYNLWEGENNGLFIVYKYGQELKFAKPFSDLVLNTDLHKLSLHVYAHKVQTLTQN